MGTTCTHKPKGEPLTDFFIREGVLRWSDDNPYTYRVLDSAFINLTEYYAAVEQVHKETGERQVWAAMIKVTMVRGPRRDRWARDDPWDHNFCYKDMDETVGPYYHNCPERILKLLTPTEHEYALEWRRKCWAKIEAKKARPKIAPGTKLKFNGAIYIAEKSLGARGWSVHKADESWSYRMNRSQVAASEILCQA